MGNKPAYKLVIASLLAIPAIAFGQASQPGGGVISVPVNGVSLSSDATLSNRVEKVDASTAAARAKAALTPVKKEQLGYISLPKLFAEAKAAREKNAELPKELRYLGGMTQIQYVFVYADDIVIAGPMEKLDVTSPLQPIGKTTGRPALQFDDLVVAGRIAVKTNGRDSVGCTIDPRPGVMDAAKTTMEKNASKSDAEIHRLLADAIGPQNVKVIGVPEDTRLAFAVVAADFKMKRHAMGLEPTPLVQIGSAVDNSRVAANRFWFETKYEPLMVSPAGDSYAIRGPRLQLKCGATTFDEKGATEKAKSYAAGFSKNVPALAAAVPFFADLQNISDLLLVTTLIQHDGLDKKIGWNFGDAVKSASIGKEVSAPKHVLTQTGSSGGSIVAGGVRLVPAPLVSEKRDSDEKEPLSSLRNRPASENWIVAPAEK
jgi:hypothetical protein